MEEVDIAGGAAAAVKGEMSEDGSGTEERPGGEGGGGSRFSQKLAPGPPRCPWLV